MPAASSYSAGECAPCSSSRNDLKQRYGILDVTAEVHMKT